MSIYRKFPHKEGNQVEKASNLRGGLRQNTYQKNEIYNVYFNEILQFLEQNYG